MTNPDVCFVVSAPMFYEPENKQKQWPLFGLLLLNSMKRYLTGSYKVIVVETEEEESIVDLKTYCYKLGPNFQYERISHPCPEYPISAKIEAMKKAVKAEKAVVLIDVDAGWFGPMDVSWFDLGLQYDIGTYPGLNVSNSLMVAGKDWDFLRKAIDNNGSGSPKNPKKSGSCGTHITILNPRFVNIYSFVDRWLENTIKMFKVYPYRECDNATFTLLTENRRIKWVERDLPNCTFDYASMGILLARFSKLMALAQELYHTDKIFQETIDKSPHRGDIVKTLLEANVGYNPYKMFVSIPYKSKSLYRPIQINKKKYFYYTDPFSRAIMNVRPKIMANFQSKFNRIPPTKPDKQIHSLEVITNPKASRTTTTTTPTNTTTQKSYIKPSHRIQAIYDRLRANNIKKIMNLGKKNYNESAKFYPQRTNKTYGGFY